MRRFMQTHERMFDESDIDDVLAEFDGDLRAPGGP
jgi:hypothetical protein